MPRGGSDAVSSKSLCPLRVLVLMSYTATSEAVLRLCRPGMQLIFEKIYDRGTAGIMRWAVS